MNKKEKIIFISNNFKNKIKNKFLIFKNKEYLKMNKKEKIIFISNNFKNKIKNKFLIFKNKENLNLDNKKEKIIFITKNIKTNIKNKFLKLKNKDYYNALKEKPEFKKIIIILKLSTQYIHEETNKIIKILSEIINRIFDSSEDEDSLMPPPQIWSRVLIWTLGTGSLFLISWSFIFKVEETIILQGEISTKSPEVKIAAIDSGKILEVFVEPFEFIEKGKNILVYSDDETPKRLSSLLIREKIILSDIEETKTSYQVDKKKLNNTINFNESLIKKLSSLVPLGVVSRQEFLDKEYQLSQAKLDLKSLNQDFIISLNSLKKNLEEVKIGIAETQLKLNRFVVKSSINGYIQSLPYQSPGELIQPGEVIATIVPDMDLIAKVSVPSKLSAPIEINAEAELDVDAYPSSDFGFVNAFVASISPMSTTSSESPQKNYQAILELDIPDEDSKISISDLRPGMGLNARVKLREKPLISTVFTFFEELFLPLSENS